MYIFRGFLTYKIGSGRIVAGDIPPNFEKYGTDQFLTIPLLTIVGVVVLEHRRLLPADRSRRS